MQFHQQSSVHPNAELKLNGWSILVVEKVKFLSMIFDGKPTKCRTIIRVA
jgi:hypothetical protein